QGALPEPFVSKGFTVAPAATVYLAGLIECAVGHQHGGHFAANTTGASRNDRLSCRRIIFSGFQFSDGVVCCAGGGRGGGGEFSNVRFESVATVKKGHRIALGLTLSYQVVDLLR